MKLEPPKLEPSPPVLLDTVEAARVLSLSPATLSTWRCRANDGPPFVRVGRRAVRYPAELLLEWAQSHRVQTSTSDVGPAAAA